MVSNKNIIQSSAIIVTFLIAVYGNDLLRKFLDVSFENNYLTVTWHYLWWIVPTVPVIMLFFGYRNFFREIGINKGFLTGLLLGAIAVMPMFLGSAWAGKIPADITYWHVIRASLLPGFMEEYLFRAFLFGILFRHLGWGFIPAALLGAFIFGIEHVYQGNSIGQSAGIFLITALGGAWYAWLMTEWDHNLWIPVFLHTFMNLSWVLFEVEDNALGGWYSNIFRILTIVIATIITVKLHKKRGMKVTRNNLWGLKT